MTRLPRRTVPAVLAGLALLTMSVLVAVSCVQLIAGNPPLLPFAALGRAAASVTLADSRVLAAGGLLALLGAVLLVCALLPGTPHVLPLAPRDGGAAAGVGRRGLANDLAGCARRTDGITAARVNVGARTVRVTARTMLRDRSGLAERVHGAIGARLAEVGLARDPRVRVRVVPDRSTR
jgi:hypothetical protein